MGLRLGRDEARRNCGEAGVTRRLSPVNMTPFVDADTIYGFDQPGMLRAVDLKTGKRLWESLAR